MPALLTWTTQSGDFKVFRFDVVTTETHEASVDITDHPVELGANVTDHARPQPERLTLEGYVSNKPLLSSRGQTSPTDALDQMMAFGQMPLTLPEARALIAQKQVVLDLPKPPIRPNVAGLVSAGVDALLGAAAPLMATVETSAPLPQLPLNPTLVIALPTFINRVWTMWETLLQARKDAAIITVETGVEYLENMMIERMAVPRTVADGGGASFQLELKRIRIVKSATVAAPIPTEARGQPPVTRGSQSTKASDADADAKMQSALRATVLKAGG
jgi:hypothetical protein